jgi:hypothetical protein
MMAERVLATEVRHQAEYQALRASIRERGTARMLLFPIIVIGWAATAIATGAVITVALSTLVPLLVLAAGFEAIFALHTNVERIGRYLQVFHEQPKDGSEHADREHVEWEHVAMEFGRRFPRSGPDPLYGRLFALAISVNYLPAALGGTEIELAVLAVFHLIAIGRIRYCRSVAAKQRALDLERFAAIANQSPTSGSGA